MDTLPGLPSDKHQDFRSRHREERLTPDQVSRKLDAACREAFPVSGVGTHPVLADRSRLKAEGCSTENRLRTRFFVSIRLHHGFASW